MDNRVQQLENGLARALEFIPDVTVASSVLALLVLFGWLAIMASREDVRVRQKTRRSFPAPSARLSRSARKTQTSTQPSQEMDMAQQHTPPTTGFSVRWDRTIIFGVSALALLIFLGTAVAALFGAQTLTLSGVSLLIGLGGLLVLRVLARRDAYQKAQARRLAALTGEHARKPAESQVIADLPDEADKVPEKQCIDVTAQAPTALATSKGETDTTGQKAGSRRGREIFDLNDDPQETGESRPERQRRDPAENVPTAQTVKHAETALEAQHVETTVKPVPVPRPTYLDAEETVRADPAPWVPDPEPQPSSQTQLKDGVSAEYKAKISATAQRRLDLDQVLNRRRAI